MERKRFLIALLVGSGILVSTSTHVLAQAPPSVPANDDDFMDDDFDPPNGTFQPGEGAPPGGPQAPMGQKTFGESVNQNPAGGGMVRPGKPGTPKVIPGGGGMGKKNLTMADATDKDITDENFPDLIDGFDYPNAQITDVVKAISKLTGKNFIIDPSVKGTITIIAPSRITVAEAYKAFLSALAINNFTVVPSGKFLKIRPASAAIKDNLDTYSGTYSPTTDSMITRIIQLRYISAKEVFNSLGQTVLVSRNGEVRPYEPTNTLIISDYGSNVERVMKILRQLDVPGFEEQLEVIRIRYARAADIAKVLDQIINKGKGNQGGPGGGFTAGIPRFTPLGGQQQGGNDAFSLVIPDERTNSLIIVGNTQGIQKIKKLVARLDFKMRPEDSGGVYVYYVKFGDAEKIGQTLSGIAQAAAQGPSSPVGPPGAAPPTRASVFGGDVKIVADKTSNSLVVSASPQDYQTVKTILAKLDVARDQVYVEGIIMEMAVQSAKNWGINYYNLIGNSFAGRSGFISDKDQVANMFAPGNDSGAILGFGGGGSVTVDVPAGGASKQLTIPSLVGFINFLATQTSVNILSTPQLMALDNEEAQIEVGEKVPTSVTTSAGTATAPPTTSIQKDDVTIFLKIKPHISPGADTVRLEIEQKQADISNTIVKAKALADSAIATTKRETKSNVMVRDGDTLVLGGLMTEKENIQVTKVPLLGDIPIIGWLFKGKSVRREKVNLVLFLTPRIVRSKTDSVKLLTEKLKQRISFIERNMGGKDTQGETFDSLRLEKNGEIQEIKPK